MNQFYIKFTRKGRTFYVDGKKYKESGKWRFVSKDKVKKAKKKVLDYSVKEKRIIDPKVKTKKATDPIGRKIIDSDILSQSIRKAIVNDADQNNKVGIKYKGEIKEVDISDPQKVANLVDLTDEIQRAYFDTFGSVVESPLLFVRYIKGSKGSVFDYDETMIGQDGEIADEFPEEYKSFRIRTGIILSKYLK